MYRAQKLPLTIVLLVILSPGQVRAQEIDGFTVPYRTIDLAFDESGTIMELYVEEGQVVAQGTPIARLDDRVQQLQLELSKHLASSVGALDVAQTTLTKRQEISANLQRLRGQGHAAESELIRSELELAIAQSRLLAAQEEAIAREIDVRRSAVLLERRTLRAPFAGHITRVHRREGEYVSPMRPEIVTLVDLNQMFAVFNVPSSSIDRLRPGQEIQVTFRTRQQESGVIHYVGVETDAQSGTILVKVLLDNSAAKLRAGEQCYLTIR